MYTSANESITASSWRVTVPNAAANPAEARNLFLRFYKHSDFA
jgi:hypothetical protein